VDFKNDNIGLFIQENRSKPGMTWTATGGEKVLGRPTNTMFVENDTHLYVI
jgi:hypothetical protein